LRLRAICSFRRGQGLKHFNILAVLLLLLLLLNQKLVRLQSCAVLCWGWAAVCWGRLLC
jgi:hypothetical protein